jgi:plasmid replication initiation protein
METTVEKSKPQTVLKKHINAIHCTNNLTLVQRKLFNALLFKAYPELPHKNRFEISTKNICELIGYNSNDHNKLKKALLGLITISIEWNLLDSASGKEKSWKASSILASAEIEGGRCYYEYSNLMRDFLYQPEIYGRINLLLVSKFKSGYGLALYENCVRYQGLPQTPWFTLDVFRKLMGVFGDKYCEYKDLNKRVLSIAVKEVNEISSLNLSVELERKNRKVVRLRFKLNDKSIKSSNQKDLALDNDDLVQLLIKTLGLSDKQITSILENYQIAYIKEKVALIINGESFKTGKIKNLSGYLMASLTSDYKAGKASNNVVVEERRKNEVEKKKEQGREAAIKKRYSDFVNKKIESYLNALTEKARAGLVSGFEAFIEKEGGALMGWYAKQGFEHAGVKSCYNKFLINEKNAIENILSFDEYRLIVDENAL